MSIPYLPGIGDTFQQVLPDLGKNLQSIFAPHITAQRDIYKQLMENPEQINQYIDLARTNPGALGLKKQDAQALATRDYTPKYKRQIEREDLDIAQNREALTAAQTSNKITAERQKVLDNIQDPEYREWATLNFLGLKSPQDFADTKLARQVNELQLGSLQRDDADALAVRNLKLTTDEVKQLVRGTLDPEKYRVIFSNPGLAKIYGQIVDTYQASLRDAAMLERTEAISMRAEGRANDRAAIEHGKERAKLQNQARMLTIDIRKKPAKENDLRMDELNRINQLLYQEHGLPFTRYEWTTKGKNRWVPVQLSAKDGAVFSELGGSLPVDFDIKQQIKDWQALTPEEQKAYTQIEPDIVALIQDKLHTSPGTDAANKPSATISSTIKGKVDESAGGRLMSAALRKAVELFMRTIPGLSEADAIKKAKEAGFK